jgi:hypothetical protein
LEKIFNEFSKSAEGVINQKYLADYSPVRSWQLKQELLTKYDGTSEDQEGQLYEMLSKPGSEWLVDIGKGNPFDGNWFTFAGTYNKDWLTK